LSPSFIFFPPPPPPPPPNTQSVCFPYSYCHTHPIFSNRDKCKDPECVEDRRLKRLKRLNSGQPAAPPLGGPGVVPATSGIPLPVASVGESSPRPSVGVVGGMGGVGVVGGLDCEAGGLGGAALLLSLGKGGGGAMGWGQSLR